MRQGGCLRWNNSIELSRWNSRHNWKLTVHMLRCMLSSSFSSSEMTTSKKDWCVMVQLFVHWSYHQRLHHEFWSVSHIAQLNACCHRFHCCVLLLVASKLYWSQSSDLLWQSRWYSLRPRVNSMMVIMSIIFGCNCSVLLWLTSRMSVLIALLRTYPTIMSKTETLMRGGTSSRCNCRHLCLVLHLSVDLCRLSLKRCSSCFALYCSCCSGHFNIQSIYMFFPGLDSSKSDEWHKCNVLKNHSKKWRGTS